MNLAFPLVIKMIVYLLCLPFLMMSCQRNEPISEKEKIKYRVLNEVINQLKDQHQLSLGGFGAEGSEKGYQLLGLNFDLYGVISKDEGRKMLVESVDLMLNVINQDKELQPYLLEKPFTSKNVDLVFFVKRKNGEDVFYPDIRIFSACGGRISYLTESPEQEFGYYTEEEETFEEARRIVEVQRQ